MTNRTLRENGVTIAGPGRGACPDLKIPYFSFEGGEEGRYPMDDGNGGDFARTRWDRPASEGAKYTQAAGTPALAYFPVGLAELLRQQHYVIVTEGEFKALSLVEAGYPAVGIGGIYNFTREKRLLPELVALFDWMETDGCGCETIHFLGDADTAINGLFSDAVVKFRNALASANVRAEVRLPRMSLAEMEHRKGIDDARQDLDAEAFRPYCDQLLADALPLSGDMEVDELAAVLYGRERTSLVQLASSCEQGKRPKLLKKLARLAGVMGAISAADVEQLCVQTQLVVNGKQFTATVKQEAKTLRAEMEQKQPKGPVEIHYCPSTAKNFIYKSGSIYTMVDRQGALDHLALAGYSVAAGSNGPLSQAATVLTNATGLPVSWCRPLGGKAAGVYPMNGRRILVTESPTLIKPQSGNWPTISAFLSAAFDYNPDDDPNSKKKANVAKEQQNVVLAWLAGAVKGQYLHGGEFSPSPALVLCGKKRAGKGCFQRLVTELLGGRAANPFGAMAGKTGNNGDLAGAEHWMVEDEQDSARTADRMEIKAAIKKACVNRATAFNPKHRDAETLPSYRRLTISLNDDEESLRVLPDLSDNFADKIILAHFLSVPGLGAETHQSWWASIVSELPAFLHYLLRDHVIVGADEAYGLIPYHDPEISGLIAGQSREAAVDALIAHYVVSKLTRTWEGTANELFDEFAEPQAREQLKAVGCHSTRVLGKCLSALVAAKPEGYQALPMLNGTARYRIQPNQCTAPMTEAAEVQALLARRDELTPEVFEWQQTRDTLHRIARPEVNVTEVDVTVARESGAAAA